MTSEIHDSAIVKPSGDGSALQDLFQEVSNDFKSFFGSQSKPIDLQLRNKDTQVDAHFGQLTLTDDAAAKPDQTVARGGHAREQSQSIREAQAKLANKETSQEEKLQEAFQLAKEGQTSFTGPDGRKYDISVTDGTGRSGVSIHTTDAQGTSHPVLRGNVDKDGHVFKQTDASGKAVAYEGDWAGRHMKDSPLIGSKEKANTVAESHETAQLKKTFADRGITPANQAPADRIALARAHGQLQSQVDQHREHLKAIKAQVEERNKPYQHQIDQINGQNDRISQQMSVIRHEYIAGNTRLAAELKDKGIGDGSRIDFDKPDAVQKVRNDIDANKNIDDAGKKHLKDEMNALEKKNSALNKLDAAAEHNAQAIEKVYDKIADNQKPLDAEQKKLGDAHKALRENEHKLAESRFSEDLKEIDKLPQAKREAITNALTQIANDSGGAPNHLTADQRKLLIEETVHQLAHPEAIKQGNKGTCGLASTEAELAKNHPEQYAKYVSDLATRGVTKTADGRELRIQSDLINTTDKHGQPVQHDDGNPKRSFISKIFQSAAANRVLEDRALAASPAEAPATYDTQRPASKYPLELSAANVSGKGDITTTEDTGERIVHKDGKVEHWNGVDADEISKLTSELTGQRYEAKPIVNGRDLSKPDQEAAVERDFLAAAEHNGLPMKVNITLNKGDFTGMNNEGGHELIVTRIEKGTPAMLYYDNTAGGTDHSYPTGRPVPLKEFLSAMQKTRMSNGNYHEQGYVITKVE